MTVVNPANTDYLAPGGANGTYSFTQLTAAATGTDALLVEKYRHHRLQAVVAGITTNVVMRAECSNDGTNWSNLSRADANQTMTADGTYSFEAERAIKYIRLYWVSEAGGTAATVDVTYFGKW